MVKKANRSKKFRFGFWPQAVLTASVAALFLTVANSAIWMNRAIFDTNRFTKTAVASFTSESSRNALANEVVDRALADNCRELEPATIKGFRTAVRIFEVPWTDSKGAISDVPSRRSERPVDRSPHSAP